jgi:hypothetical protein
MRMCSVRESVCERGRERARARERECVSRESVACVRAGRDPITLSGERVRERKQECVCVCACVRTRAQ